MCMYECRWEVPEVWNMVCYPENTDLCRYSTNASRNGFGMDVFTLHECRQPVWLDGERRYTVVARQRISERHQLAGVRRVGQAFGITRHGCVEDHLSRYRFFKAERLAVEAAPVVED